MKDINKWLMLIQYIIIILIVNYITINLVYIILTININTISAQFILENIGWAVIDGLICITAMINLHQIKEE